MEKRPQGTSQQFEVDLSAEELARAPGCSSGAPRMPSGCSTRRSSRRRSWQPRCACWPGDTRRCRRSPPAPPLGIAVQFPALAIGEEHQGAWGWSLRHERERYVLDKGDGLRWIFAATDEQAQTWKLIELRDRHDNHIDLTYDDAGALCEVTDSAGRTIGVETTRAGRIASLRVKHDRWMTVARFAYDDEGHLVAAIDAAGHAERYEYDDEHRLTCKIDRCGLAFHFAYDRQGRCVESWGDDSGRRDASLAEDVPSVLADGSRARTTPPATIRRPASRESTGPVDGCWRGATRRT